MKNIIYLLLLLTIIGCSTRRTDTLYITKERIPVPRNLGYSQISEEEEITKVYERTSVLHDSIMNYELSKIRMKSNLYRINDFIGFESINRDSIVQICSANNLDGYIVTSLKFNITIYKISRKRSEAGEDVVADMFYFNPKGELLLHIRYNTYVHENYMDYPKFDESIPDGIEGALSEIFDEIIMSQNRK